MGENGVSRYVGKDCNGEPYDGRSPCGQSIYSICDIGSVGYRSHNEDHDQDVENRCSSLTQESKYALIIELIVFHKWDGGLHCLHVFEGRCLYNTFLDRYWIGKLSYHYAIVKVQCSTYYYPNDNLTHNLEPTCKSILIFPKYFDIIIQKAYSAQPNGSNQQKNDVNIIDIGKKQSRNDDTGHDHQSAHGWGTFFLLLTF